MREDFDSNVKLGVVFKELQGLDLTIEGLDLPVRIYNCLKRNDIHDLDQILSMSVDEFISILVNKEKRIRSYAGIIDQIVEQLRTLAS